MSVCVCVCVVLRLYAMHVCMDDRSNLALQRCAARVWTPACMSQAAGMLARAAGAS